jgi:hypothetical protein
MKVEDYFLCWLANVLGNRAFNDKSMEFGTYLEDTLRKYCINVGKPELLEQLGSMRRISQCLVRANRTKSSSTPPSEGGVSPL